MTPRTSRTLIASSHVRNSSGYIRYTGTEAQVKFQTERAASMPIHYSRPGPSPVRLPLSSAKALMLMYNRHVQAPTFCFLSLCF